MQRTTSWKQRFFVATVSSMLGIGLVGLTAWGQESPAKQPAKEVLKTYAFEFRDTPWDKVLDWLADNSGGMPIVGGIKPQGTFNFINSGGKKHTLPQIIDILNRSLNMDKIRIIRGSQNFTVISSDEALTIDTTILPNITVEDLEIDKAPEQQKFGASELAQITFNLNGLTVDEAELNLTSRKGPFGRFQKIPKGSMLLATDTVGNLRQMKRLLDKIDPSAGDSSNLEVFSLRPSVDGSSMETNIKGMFNLNPGQTNPVPNPPKIQYDSSLNKIIVTGDKAQLKSIREILTKLNAIKAAPAQTPVEPGPNKTTTQPAGLGPVEDSIRTVVLKVDNASQYVDNLRFMLESLRANPVYVTLEPVMVQDLENARKGQSPKIDPKKQQLFEEKQVDSTQISNKPGDPKRPIFIASMSRANGVVLGSDDPEALDFAEQILAYLTKDGDTNYEIIPLKNSNAQIVRDTLDELINGKRQQGGNPMAMMMGGFGGGGNMRDAVTGPVVRLAADKRTNSLLVRAPRQIAVTIRRFVETELDVNNIEQKLQPIPRIIPLKYADATEVADVLKEIYKEYVQASPGGGMQPGMPFNPFMQQQQQQQPERSIKLNVTAHTQDNSLILNCPEVIWPEVQKLVADLDKNDSDNTKQVKIINVGKADPVMLQRAVDAITGKKNATNGQQNDPQAAMRNALMQRFGGMGGMGFPAGGGGGGPRQGGGGGGNRGGGGGGNRGGGGGGNRGGGNRNRFEEPPAILRTTQDTGGKDFFADRVKDDPRTQVTFDPEPANNNIIQAQAQQGTPAQQPQGTFAQQPGTNNQPPATTTTKPLVDDKGNINAPRSDVTVEILPDGQVVLVGSPEAIREMETILSTLAKTSPSAETELRIFDLSHIDCTTAVNQLSTIFNKYNPVVKVITGSGSTPAPGGAPGGGFGGGRPGGFQGGGFQGGGQNQGGMGQLGGGANVQPVQQPSGLLLMALLRQNGVLIGAPKAAMEEIGRVIKLIDKPIDPESAPKIIKLSRANAQSIGQILTLFYQQRYGSDQPNEIRIQSDVRTNSLLVHAGPADLKELESLVAFFDKAETKVVNEVRIKQLKNANAQELATILQQALSQALLQAPPATGTGTGAQGANPFQNIFGGAQQQQQGGAFGQNRQGAAGGLGAQGTERKGVSLAFSQLGRGRIETGLLDDVGIYADTRSNRLIISAPPEAIVLLEKLIDELDVPPSVTAEVKVFRLKNTDAQSAITTLQGIFSGVNQQRQGGVGGGQQGGFFGGGNFGNQNQNQQLNFSASQGQGPQPLIPRFSVDIRTNSLIVAAGRGDMILIEVLLNNIDSSAIRDRLFQVVRLKNNQAGNIATNLNNFFGNEIRILQLNDLTTFTQSDREVTVIADASNNSLLVGASQRYFAEVLRLIDQMDVELAQVAIQVLIAAVDMNNSDEFGVEVGLQSPVLFERSLFNPVAATTATNPNIGAPGFPFNNVSSTVVNNSTNIHPDVVGLQGLTNYGTGRANPNNGVGGFVFSAASNSVNVLVRALRTQGRIEVLSRPQIVTRDNQQALISVGQQVPIVTGSNITAQGIIQNTIEQQQVGIILKVLPQISPDGRIVMRVEPQVSRVSNSTVDIGNGVRGTIIDQTIASTTIEAFDGKTVVIGGLINKRDDKEQRGIPWLGDLPYVGALFRYRRHDKQKQELLIIMTPHIIRNQMDADRIFAEESRKMHWSLDDVQAIHGAIPGNSFLQKNCDENGLPGAVINPFNERFFAPNSTPVDEKLQAPQGGTIRPQPQQQLMPAPQQQQQTPATPQAVPPWLQPPGATPPQFQAPQQQSWQQQQQRGPVNNVVTGLPPVTMNQQALQNMNPQAMTYGQAMQLQQQQYTQPQVNPVTVPGQPQQQVNGTWKTSVIYGPADPAPGTMPVQPQQPASNFGGQQQP